MRALVYHTEAPGQPNGYMVHDAEQSHLCTLFPCAGHRKDQLKGYRSFRLNTLFTGVRAHEVMHVQEEALDGRK